MPRYPTWPLPSSVYPNSCSSIFPSTTHVVRVAFSGGITRDGVIGVTPDQTNLFTLRSRGEEVAYLGLGDLGKALARPGELYQQDGDNYLDICLDLTNSPEVVQADLALTLHCDQEQVRVEKLPVRWLCCPRASPPLPRARYSTHPREGLMHASRMR